MIRHVLFTGEIGEGKSTALRRTLTLLRADAWGIETYSPQPRGEAPRGLYIRPYGSPEMGKLLAMVPGECREGATPLFDSYAVRLLDAARKQADLIVIDEIGRLERDAKTYHGALRASFDGNKPVLGVLRKHKAEWADWIRKRDDVLLLEVTRQNRDELPALAAERIRRQTIE
ncbi:MAG: hypothetical protein IKK34_07450 [Clostridia bacterium]|nr:hypothetical protein [Clostridia bacterium]